MYPLVLTPEELFCLRLMLRIVITRKIIETSSGLREALKESLAQTDDGLLRAEQRHSTKVLALCDSFRRLDHPLFHAGITKPNQSVVVSYDESAFHALKGVASFKFIGDSSDPQIEKTLRRIIAAQPAIRAAFKVAETNGKDGLSPNVPPAEGAN